MYFGRASVPQSLKNQSLYHKILLLQKFNDRRGKVLKSKTNQPATSEKKMRPFFSFLIVSDCMVYPELKFLIFSKYQKFMVRVNHTTRHNEHNQTQ